MLRNILQTRSGREREVWLRKGVLHFELSSESYPDMGDCYCNSRVLQHTMLFSFSVSVSVSLPLHAPPLVCVLQICACMYKCVYR